ncbi:unnamed protein product [Ilex paraguariensis]|uniref:Uncharacterized protein n=1 Tax=Ilex paraguariensis TaxID=185542 RepID=A0ABC8T0M8_9AQUA
MGSKHESPKNATTRRRRSRSSNSHRRFCRPKKSSNTVVNDRTGSSSSVAEKLKALRNLIPAAAENKGEIKGDQLFQETADYILLLRSQVLVLQKLVDFYGSCEGQKAVS